MSRRTTLLKLIAAGAALALGTPAALAQQAYPNRVIRLIVPFAPGGQTDILARLVSQHLSEKLGQQVIVENRAGGNSIIGTEVVAKSPPDGYTLLLAGSTHVIAPLLAQAPFDPIKDFAPIATVSASPLVLAANPAFAPKTVRELIALAKEQPGKLNYASYGSGSPSHLGGELFNLQAGVKMQHVPYKGAAPAVNDLLGGQVQLFLVPPGPITQHVKTGKLKALAVAGDTRIAALADVPTFAEAGMPDFNLKVWLGVFARAGTPPAIVQRLSAEIGELLTRPETKQNLAAQGIDAYYTNSEQFAALLKSDMAKYDEVVKTAKIKID